MRRSWLPALLAICLVALAIRLAAAVASPNLLWPDEIFQTLEQAHRLVFGYGVVPWEFRVGARSWLLPGALAGAMEPVRWAGGLAHVRAAQLVLSIVSLSPVCVAFLWAWHRGLAPALVASAACAVWSDLVFFAPKALNEVVAAHVLLAGLYLGSVAERRGRTLAGAGAALALAAALRVQLAPAAAVAAVFAGWREPARWKPLLLGAAPVVAGVGLLDLATWSRPFHSYLVSIAVNVVEKRSHTYGIAPWHAYFGMIREAWSWALLPLLALAAVGARRRVDAAAAAVAILATHIAFSHKELRFIYPAIVLCIVLAALGTAEAVAWAGDRFRAWRAPAWVAAVALWAGTSAVVGWRSPAWAQGRSGLEAMRLAGTLEDLCGLALVGRHWAWTGGYTYLHRDVPIYIVDDTADLARAWGGFDAALARPEHVRLLPGFAAERCWDGLCLARRPGGCAPVEAPSINARLAERDE
jgi:hypothetical protein